MWSLVSRTVIGEYIHHFPGDKSMTAHTIEGTWACILKSGHIQKIIDVRIVSSDFIDLIMGLETEATIHESPSDCFSLMSNLPSPGINVPNCLSLTVVFSDNLCDVVIHKSCHSRNSFMQSMDTSC